MTIIIVVIRVVTKMILAVMLFIACFGQRCQEINDIYYFKVHKYP